MPPWLSGKLDDSIASNFRSLHEFESQRERNFVSVLNIYVCCITHRFISAWLKLLKFYIVSVLVVLNYNYCCLDCGVRIELIQASLPGRELPRPSSGREVSK